jgi:hypothetical protein
MLEKYSTAAARGTVDIFYPLLLVPTTLRPPTIGQPFVKVVSDWSPELPCLSVWFYEFHFVKS